MKGNPSVGSDLIIGGLLKLIASSPLLKKQIVLLGKKTVIEILFILLLKKQIVQLIFGKY